MTTADRGMMSRIRKKWRVMARAPQKVGIWYTRAMYISCPELIPITNERTKNSAKLVDMSVENPITGIASWVSVKKSACEPIIKLILQMLKTFNKKRYMNINDFLIHEKTIEAFIRHIVELDRWCAANQFSVTEEKDRRYEI